MISLQPHENLNYLTLLLLLLFTVNLNTASTATISRHLVINEHLKLTCFIQNSVQDWKEFNKPNITYNDIYLCLLKLTSSTAEPLSISAKLEKAASHLSDVMEDPELDDLSDKRKNVLRFTHNNLENCMLKKPRYSLATKAYAFLLFSISPKAYEQSMRYLMLPCIDYIRKLEGRQNVSPEKMCHNDVYLKKIRKKIEPSKKNRHVILAFDEVYVEPAVSRVGQNHAGLAENKPGELATTILSVMIICPFSRYRDVYAMYPVSSFFVMFSNTQINL